MPEPVRSFVTGINLSSLTYLLLIKRLVQYASQCSECFCFGFQGYQVSDISICIMRLSAIGDATHVVPVIRTILKHMPQARITWIIGKLEARLLNGLPGVEFIVFDKKGGFAAIRELRKTLKGRKFDFLLHMQVAARANLLSMLVKSPVRIGWDKSRWRDRHQWFINQSLTYRRKCTRLTPFWRLPTRSAYPRNHRCGIGPFLLKIRLGKAGTG